MSNTTKLRVSFKQVIDNEKYNFKTKSEAVEIAKDITNGNCSNFDFNVSKDYDNDPEPYLYLIFSEYVYVEVVLDGSPLYTLLNDVKPVIVDGVFSSVKRI